ncbi:pleckstrin homology domain-containing family A member 8-like [Puntigrus tetrazona]|uniref:pleckstrin homology domain-containing family A member 8-like n=1 Tax=Puntigrus tetrazona TaxID=1606681 RepID=UPI001C893FE8|nr:pleckstrin homology domain-containing family A member 8-like [Puntigrus tetrazona]
MEGVLYKWTNYISGWQPRWFVLEGGTLSYYDSQEDAWKGCKGSIKISVCEIQVHPSDFTRVDLIIPGEQYFYLRAINAAERQKWLVALGTAKACLTDNRTKREKGECCISAVIDKIFYVDHLACVNMTVKYDNVIYTTV